MSSSNVQIPSAQRAIAVKHHPRTVVLTTKPIPQLQDDEILVKVVAVTLNPTDFKHVAGVLEAGDSVGCDFAGDVVKVGSAVQDKGFKVGDPVAGYIRGGAIEKNNGTFQEYVKTLPELAWHVPTGVLSYEDAAAMGGISLSTAVQALYHRLDLPPPWAPSKEPLPVLIWAGSTSVGIYAIRLAKLSGLSVATTASPQNHQLMKSLGADVVFDYKDPDAPSKIKDWSSGKLKHGLDTIAEHGSADLAAQAFSSEGGTLITLLPTKITESSNVKVQQTLVYSALDRNNEEDFKKMAEWYRHVPEIASQLKVMPLKKWPAGIEGIPDALLYLQAGKTSAEKISVVL